MNWKPLNLPTIHNFKFQDLYDEVLAARSTAHRYARRDYKFVRGRGTQITTSVSAGYNPYESGDCIIWDETKKDLMAAINRIIEKYPNVTKLYIAGGYDGAPTLQDLNDGAYTPRAESWEVCVFENKVDECVGSSSNNITVLP